MSRTFFVNSNWKLNNTMDWLKCHVIAILLFSILPLVAGLCAGIIMDDYSIIYPIPVIVPWFLIMKLAQLLIVFTIQWMIDHYKRKKSIMAVSLIMNIFQSIFYIIPLIIMLLVDLYVDSFFNIYMVLATYVYLATFGFVVEFLYNKYFANRKRKNKRA